MAFVRHWLAPTQNTRRTLIPSPAPSRRPLWTTLVHEPFSGGAWHEFLYALVALPVALAGFVFTAVSLVAGAILTVILVGLPLFALSSFGVRWLGGVNRSLARRLLGMRVAPPPRLLLGPGLVGLVRSGVVDRPNWRARGYLAVKLPIAIVEFVVAVVLRLGAVWFVLAPMQWAVNLGTETVDDHGVIRHSVLNFGSFYFDTWPKTFMLVGLGVVAWWLAPWALRTPLYLDRQLIADLLGPTSLSSRVSQLERSRAEVIDDASAQLQRIERDLHDGAQAELVGLAVKLGLAREKLAAVGREEDHDLDRARQLVNDAHRGAKLAITELRDLVRGIHPPALDEGIEVALATLSARSSVPVDLTVTLAARPSPAIETTIYFCAAELLTNVAKHAKASVVHMELVEDGDLLRLGVADDGVGGAHLADGGLNGLADRLDIVDGQLEVSSPPGGPSVVTVTIPLQT